MKINTNTLKITGIIFMLIAHIAFLFPKINTLWYGLTFISRYTVIIFSYMLVIGFNNTKNIKKYIIRMFLFGIFSQPFFNYFITGNFLIFKTFNIMITMFITLLCLLIIKKEKDLFIKISLVFTLYTLSLLSDWGTIFIPMTLIIYYFNKNKSLRNILLSALFIIYMLFQNNKIIYLGFLIQLLLINYVDLDKRNKINLKYFFYFFYPLHLLILRLVYPYFN